MPPKKKKYKLDEGMNLDGQSDKVILSTIRKIEKIGVYTTSTIDVNVLKNSVIWHRSHQEPMTPRNVVVEGLERIINMSMDEITYNDDALVELTRNVAKHENRANARNLVPTEQQMHDALAHIRSRREKVSRELILRRARELIIFNFEHFPVIVLEKMFKDVPLANRWAHACSKTTRTAIAGTFTEHNCFEVETNRDYGAIKMWREIEKEKRASWKFFNGVMELSDNGTIDARGSSSKLAILWMFRFLHKFEIRLSIWKLDFQYNPESSNHFTEYITEFPLLVPYIYTSTIIMVGLDVQCSLKALQVVDSRYLQKIVIWNANINFNERLAIMETVQWKRIQRAGWKSA